MSEPSNTPARAAVQRTMARLDGFVRSLGLVEAATRHLVEAVVSDLPSAEGEVRLAKARLRMIVASA